MNRITSPSIVPFSLSLMFWLAAAGFGQAGCAPAWAPGAFVTNGTNGTINALCTFDDGGGPALYAGGSFSTAGGAVASNVARWNGSSWSSVGGGVNGQVLALAVFDDGGGPALYAGGLFTAAAGNPASFIARWNGTAWSAVGAGTNAAVHALAVFGSGPSAALYAGGAFTFPALNVARWGVGGGWSAAGGLPGSFMSTVRTLVTWDDGTGPALYAGGTFTPPNFNANNVWKWDGVAPSWSIVGTGILSPSSGGATVFKLCVHDDGSGSALFAGGAFAVAGGVSAASIAKWNGSAWSALGTGLNGSVTALGSFDDGTGPALFASGFISTAGGAPATGIARWSGGAWSAIGTGLLGQGWAMAVHDDGGGPALFVGGGFTVAGGQAASNVVKLTTSWQSLGPDGSAVGTVNALAVYDDGAGPRLYAGGMFTTGALFGATNLAKWNLGAWTPIAAGIDGPILSLCVFDDGGGPRLYAGGLFFTIGGVPTTAVARWNGVAWSPVGTGIGSGQVHAMAVYDDGTGPALYVGGFFQNAGGNPAADYFAKWNGTAWSPVVSGFVGVVNALLVHDDGSGPALIVGGDFTVASGGPGNRVAKWNGTAWSPVGAGVDGSVWCLASYAAPSGQPLLAAGGDFTHAAGAPASKIASWNGAAWSPLGAGLDDRVRALRMFDDGGGPALWAGGQFASAGGSPALRLARWNGDSWSAPGDAAGAAPANLVIRSLVPFDDGGGVSLYAGGAFASIGGVVSTSVARRVVGGPPVVRATLLPQIAPPGGTVSFGAAVSPTLTIGPASGSDAGVYDLLASNACGSASSNAAPLAVIPGLATYGTATAGCAGLPWIGALSAPQVGNAAFFLGAANLPPGQQGLCAVSGAPLGTPLWLDGLAAWIDPSSPALFFIPAATDAGGFCIVPAALPPDPGLIGATGFVQMAMPDACAPGGLAATNALAVTIVP
jgi:trimeric autotransporter adhesin